MDKNVVVDIAKPSEKDLYEKFALRRFFEIVGGLAIIFGAVFAYYNFYSQDEVKDLIAEADQSLEIEKVAEAEKALEKIRAVIFGSKHMLQAIIYLSIGPFFVAAVFLYLALHFFKRKYLEEVEDFHQKIHGKNLTIKQVNEQLERLEKPDPKYKRFETIHANCDKKLKYGYVDYKPFFWAEDYHDHRGIGIEVLRRAFSVSDFGEDFLTPYDYMPGQLGNWNNILRDLTTKNEDGKYPFDIVMTPLFETRSRLYDYDVLFCTPLFYSNIGLYPGF